MAVAVVTSLNPLEENITFQKTPVSNKFYTSKLLNYVESVEIGGFRKTVFYTELNTNFNVGDRVFIVNGNYDSADFISIDKYTKYTDGYRVLGCDGCRLILDLDYTGQLPYIDDNLNKSIKVYRIRNQREFDYINSIKINITPISFRDDTTVYNPFPSNGRISKFAGKLYNLGTPATTGLILFSDSIIYVDTSYLGSTSIYNQNSGNVGSGFFVRDDTAAIPQWLDVTNEVLSNNIRVVNPNYSEVENTLYIYGENFTVNSLEFNQRNTYTFQNGWKLNPKYKIPYISKLNFRFGAFKGKHNDGIYGTNIKKNNWNSATWNSGALLNTNWNSGSMNSKSTAGEKSYYSTLRTGQVPVQTIDFSNNRGFGYNLVEDSTILSGEIKNGNFENSNLFFGSTFSAMNVYFGQTYSFGLKLSGSFIRCDIDNVISENAKFTNSIINNSNLSTSEIVNSQVFNSTANLSQFTDDDGINVLSSDLWSYNSDINQTSTIRGILKLYISDIDSEKISTGDAFYLTKVNKNLFLNSLTDDQKIKLPIETKFIFDIYSDLDLESGKIVVSVKNKNDNKIKTTVRRSFGIPLTYNNVFTQNNVNYASIDIESFAFGWYERTTTPTFSIVGGPTIPSVTDIVFMSSFLNPIGLNDINTFFTNTYLRNSDFRSGYLDNSNWKSGGNINYKHHIIPFNGSNLNVTYATNDTLFVGLNPNTRLNSSINIPGEDLSVGDIVWLDSIDEVAGGSIKSIGGRYRVTNISTSGSNRAIYLRNLEGLTFSSTGVYRVNGATNLNYTSIHKFRINNSTITSGLLSRTSIKGSTILNTQFNNFDKNLDNTNIERLRLINILFKDNNNKVNSGYIFKSHFINEVWNSGIVFNSIWNGGSFGNGTFNSGYWQSGIFKNGSFINSKETTSSQQDYDNTALLYRTWLNGTFEFGEFFNSTWMSGTFSNGRFYNSEWFAGIWNNGILGSSNLRDIDTKMGYSSPLVQSGTSTIWNNGIVENGVVGGSGSVYWYGGKFNNGEFTSFGKIPTNESIWYDGEFNNGKFTNLARWKNGKFLKGKFHSYFGMTAASPTNPSTYSTSYAWENGKFLGGEFGNADTMTNSVWFNGEFAGGIFQGKFWYDGLFTKGKFYGSGSGSSIFDSKNSNLSEYNFVDSFRNKYYGLWYNGIVSDNPKNVKTDERVFTEVIRKVEEAPIENIAEFRNSLWLNGTFSHKGGTFQTSVWLKGGFYDGIFDSSIFNAYVDRTFSGGTISSFASTQSCVWYGGKFDSTLGTGSFYISNWEKGTFNNGYMAGSTWKGGVWNYGFADNMIWLDGLWRNGNWNGAPFDYTVVDNTVQPFKIRSGRSKDLIINVGKNLGDLETIYLNNVFSASNATQILTNPTISSINQVNSSVYSANNGFYLYAVPSRNTSNLPVFNGQTAIWTFDNNFQLNQTQTVNNSHVRTRGGTVPLGQTFLPESDPLFACLNGVTPNLEVFTQALSTYIITIDIAVEAAERVDVFFKVGNRDEINVSLLSNAINVAGTINYYPKFYTLNFIYNTGNITPVAPDETRFYVRKGRGGLLRVLLLDIISRDYEYHPVYNNTLFDNAIDYSTNQISLPADNKLEILSSSNDGNLVSINIGNGLFKSGIWENGIWNNGVRGNLLLDEPDYFKFSDIVGLNGVIPYSGKGTYQISSNTWLVTLQSIESLQGLNAGDKVSIGNLVAIDINESRKLIKDYFTIREVDLSNGTIVVELITNFPVIRVERDSDNHLIYVSKNIWLTGAFLNGLFRGIWNNGLFKSYPRIGVVEDTHWIDGKFDGGRFISLKDSTNLIPTYNTGLVQNFTFFDNNVADARGEVPKYTSWMDINYGTTSISTINTESTLGALTNYPIGPSLPTIFTYSTTVEQVLETNDNRNTSEATYLEGYITDDVLQSISRFKDKTNSFKQLNLGTKFTVFQNFIPNDGNFIDTFSNNLGFGIGMTPFVNDGWTFTDFSSSFFATSSITYNPVGSQNVSQKLFIISGSPVQIDSNVISTSPLLSPPPINQLRLSTSPNLESVTLQVWYPSLKIQVRFIKFVLNNDNIETVKNRYYVTKVDFANAYFRPATWNLSASPALQKIVSSASIINLKPGFNEYSSLFSGVRTQYFYNKRNLDLNIEMYSQLREVGNNLPSTIPFPPPVSNNQFEVTFNNISFLEVDMIPFFNYYQNETYIDKRIKTPWFAVAPFIDYSNSEFDFLGNINLTIDSELINNQVNYTLLSAGNVGGTINTPPGTGTIGQQTSSS